MAVEEAVDKCEVLYWEDDQLIIDLLKSIFFLYFIISTTLSLEHEIHRLLQICKLLSDSQS